ncbi:MAG: nucleotidyltransferase domain-containing protein [Candidatus Asgardarchaeum sp.]
MSKFGVIWNGRYAEEILEDFLKDLKSREVKLRAVVVIGSRARGAWSLSSDLDLVIIIEDEQDLKKVLLAKNIGIIDPKPYTVEDLWKALRDVDTTIVEALEYGIVVYDDGVWDLLKKEYEKSLKSKVKIEFDESGKIIRIALVH